jgi:hypothetical protein
MNVNFFVFLTLLALTIKCSIAAPSLFPNVIAYCDKGWEYSEFFSKCYPDCKPGYSGKGPTVCCDTFSISFLFILFYEVLERG